MTNSESEFTARVDQITASEWSALVPRFDDASVYQTWQYGAVCWNEKQLSHLVLQRGKKAVAIAQVRVVRLPVVGSGIAYVRWGPLCRLRGEPFDERVLAETLQALKAEYSGRRGLMLRLIPNAYQDEATAGAWTSALEVAGFRADPKVHLYRTMRVNLCQTADDLRKGLGQRWRNYLKNAEKCDYTVVEGANTELYEVFLALYRQMMARKQFDTTVDVDEFSRLQAALPDPLKMYVLVCQKEGRALNALVVSAVGESAIYLLAATGDEGLKERGAHLLQWRAMQWLQQQGCRWYDVGGINPDRNPGVYQFKSGLGGAEVRQLGGYELSGSWLNSLVVNSGERLRAAAKALKKRRQPAAAVEA